MHIIIYSYSDVRNYDSHIHSICVDFCAEMQNLELGPSSLGDFHEGIRDLSNVRIHQKKTSA